MFPGKKAKWVKKLAGVIAVMICAATSAIEIPGCPAAGFPPDFHVAGVLWHKSDEHEKSI